MPRKSKKFTPTDVLAVISHPASHTPTPRPKRVLSPKQLLHSRTQWRIGRIIGNTQQLANELKAEGFIMMAQQVTAAVHNQLIPQIKINYKKRIALMNSEAKGG